ncbi:MAG TPA: family 65 glycosyl hydrolase, partial [Bacteroidales bacterium]|nr:family 65 glycosyl hydrolase [Bacteroidales bacterium]
HFAANKGKYVMHGVTGPNEYENNVNNNWYTNYIAVWTLRYTLAMLKKLKAEAPKQYEAFVLKRKFDEASETAKWADIVENMYFPFDEKLNVFVQHDGFMEKEQLTV